VLGITFKENCPDIRNSRVIDVIRELQDFGCVLDIFDPWADAAEVFEEYGVGMSPADQQPVICDYDAVVLAVAHHQFVGMPLCPTSTQVVYDIKSILPESDGSL
jgi:UDP-N-acetyl-D-galactosamine dehydrogenase